MPMPSDLKLLLAVLAGIVGTLIAILLWLEYAESRPSSDTNHPTNISLPDPSTPIGGYLHTAEQNLSSLLHRTKSTKNTPNSPRIITTQEDCECPPSSQSTLPAITYIAPPTTLSFPSPTFVPTYSQPPATQTYPFLSGIFFGSRSPPLPSPSPTPQPTPTPGPTINPTMPTPPPTSPVPEPTTWITLVFGFFGLAAFLRRPTHTTSNLPPTL